MVRLCLSFSFFSPNRALYCTGISMVWYLARSTRWFISASISNLWDVGFRPFKISHRITLKPVKGSSKSTRAGLGKSYLLLFLYSAYFSKISFIWLFMKWSALWKGVSISFKASSSFSYCSRGISMHSLSPLSQVSLKRMASRTNSSLVV